MGLGQGCGEVIADPSEIVLGQSELTSELAGIPLSKPDVLSVESGSSLVDMAASWSVRMATAGRWHQQL